MPGKDMERWQQNEDGSWSRASLEIKLVAPAPVENVTSEDKVNATTGAITAAAELGVDLASISGTGKDGKVTKADVEAAAN